MHKEVRNYSWQRGLVFVPHPDDEVIGCGGFLLKIADKILLRVILFTKGDKLVISSKKNLKRDCLKKKRVEEFKKVMEIIGIDNFNIMDFPDGELQNYSGDLENLIRLEVNNFKPDIIIAPYMFDAHADHRAVGKVIYKIYRERPDIDYFMFQVYNFVKPNVEVDITNVKSKLETLFDIYQLSLNGKTEEFKKIYIEGIRRLYALPSSKYIEPILYINEFNSFNSLLEYILGGETCSESSLAILEKIEQYGFFLHRVKEIESKMKEKERALLSFEIDNYIKDMHIQELETQIEELYRELEYIKKSIFYKMMKKYRNCVDKYFPENKLRGKIYRQLIGKIKSWISL